MINTGLRAAQLKDKAEFSLKRLRHFRKSKRFFLRIKSGKRLDLGAFFRINFRQRVC